MLKTFFISIIVFVSSLLLLAPIAFSIPLSQNLALITEVTVTNPQPQVKSEKTDPVQPSETTQNNQQENRPTKTSESPSEKTPKATATRAYPQPPHSYNMEKIEEFDQELYGD